MSVGTPICQAPEWIKNMPPVLFLLSYIFETLPKGTQSQKTQEENYQCIGIRTWGFIVCEP